MSLNMGSALIIHPYIFKDKNKNCKKFVEFAQS